VDAKEFNEQFKTILSQPLTKIGFQAVGRSLFCVKGETVLAVLRLQRKGSALLRRTHFLVGIRHAFLRTLEKGSAAKFPTDPSDYPFKSTVSELPLTRQGDWRYIPCNLGHWKYDTIGFGDLSDATNRLEHMRDQISDYSVAWMDRLTPEAALRQIERHGEDAYCEKLWIEDYQSFLKETDKT
jgi:hypothetical protein